MATGTAYIKLPLLQFVWNHSIGTNILSLPPLIIISGYGINAGTFPYLSLPRLTVASSGLHGIISIPSNYLQLPRLTETSIGLRGPLGGTPHPLLLPLLLISTSHISRVGSSALKLKLLKVLANEWGSRIGSASLELPPLNVLNEIYFNPKGSSILILPLLNVIGSGEGRLDVKVLGLPIRKGFAMNLVNWAVTEYENYPFNSFAYFNGVQLGFKEDGIFILDGPDDEGKDILAYIEGGTEDLFRKFMSRLREAWIESRQDGPLVLKVMMGEEETSPVYEGPIESSGRHMHEERVKFPRGLKGRYASFRLENVNGSDVDIKRIKIFLEEVQRRR